MVITSILLAAAVAAGNLQNAADVTLGATATFDGAPNNKDWPARNAIIEKARGVLFGAPMKNGRININLITKCHIEKIDLVQLDYRGTMNVKKAEIFFDGKSVKTVDLEELPGKPQSVEVKGEAAQVSVKCLDTFPPMKDKKTGKPGPNYGGWAKIRVWVSDDVKSLMEPPSSYKVEKLDVAVQKTGSAAVAGGVKVFGEPRVSKGHPCTTWDKQDVAEYRAMLKTSPEFKRMAEALKRAMDKRITEPTGVPKPLGKDENGKWKHLMDQQYGKIHNRLSLDVANLGTCYQLFGDEKYAECAKKILLDYAAAFPQYGVGARPTFRHDPSILFDQRLGDATCIIQFAIGWDFVKESKCFSAEDIRNIQENFILADARHIRANRAHLIGASNWSAIGTAACLACGVACDDEDMINTALWGYRWSSLPEAKRDPAKFNKWWEGDYCAKPNGIELHFSGKSIDVDGMWCEGAMGYQFMALQALVVDAEILWHRGIDMYRYRDGAMKAIFDSPILFSYPNYITPAIHDSGNASIVGREAYLYEFGYKRYRDPAYLPILQKVSRRLGASFQQFTVSCLYDIGASGEIKPVENPSVDLNGVGYAVLRSTDARGTRNLLVDYGPNRSHGHPDKLNIDFWAFGNLQIPDPGSAWYETPIYRNWFRTTFAHNTINVDMCEQNPCDAELLGYAPGDAIGLMRARTDKAYPGVIMDRSLALTRDYVADLYGAFAKMPRLFDLTWHPRGEADYPAGLVDASIENAGNVPGYNQLKNIKSVKGAEAQKVAYVNKNLKTTLNFAGGIDTEFIVAKAQISTAPGAKPETPVIERRKVSETVFGNVFDISGEEKVTKVVQGGTSKDGFAALAIELKDGKDLFLAAYLPGEHKFDGASTDAQMAFVSSDKDRKVKALALVGGTTLKVAGGSLKLSAVGGAVVERTDTGSYLVKNTSKADLVINVAVLGQSKKFELKSGAAAEWLINGAKPIAQHKAEVLKKLAEEAAAKEAAAKAAAEKHAAELKALAAAKPGRSGTSIAIQAEDFVAESHDVRLNETKKAIIGKCFSHWDADGQWIEWKVDVPAEGYYNVTFCYCSDSNRQRSMSVNGEAIADAAAVSIPGTGGFANSSDDWRLFTFAMPDDSGSLPVLFKAGENTIRLFNVGGGGVNMDYLLVTSPDVTPVRLKN